MKYRYRGVELTQKGDTWYFGRSPTDEFDCSDTTGLDGPYYQKMRNWAQRNGLVYKPGLSYRCLGKLTIGRSHTCGWYPQRDVCKLYREKHYEWFDHQYTFWDPKEKSHVITAQPYNVSLEDFKEMEAFAEANGLTVSISLDEAWHTLGWTPLIVWRKGKQAKDPCNENENRMRG